MAFPDDEEAWFAMHVEHRVMVFRGWLVLYALIALNVLGRTALSYLDARYVRAP